MKKPTPGQTMLRLRKEKDLSRRQLEDLSGIAQRTISYIETDHPKGRNPTTDTVKALAAVLGPEVYTAFMPEFAILSAKDDATRVSLNGVPLALSA